MKIKLFILLIMFLISPSYSIAKERTTEQSLLSKERHGIRLHKKEKHKKAYKKLHDTAQWGLKDSQYFLGIMYLKGQFIAQDLIKGMGYIGVANEVDIKERIELFDSIYEKLSSNQKKQVDERVVEYIAKIGMKAKSLKCVKNKEQGSSVGSRKIVISCSYYKTNIGGEEVE